ncbi:MAG TPA: iron ABC transporter permease [Alphaproteobacteria bacterium]|nr:iron ABC transporter permease [Alphaproteobacteria bacterium]
MAALALGVVIVLLFFASLAVGRSGLGLVALVQRAHGEDAQTVALILREIRLPRAILGLLVGSALGLAGAALQGLLRNPLAEPGLIGASGAAALGAVATLYFGLSGLFALALPLGGLAGAFLAVALLYGIAGREGGVLTLILAGIALNSFSAALTALLLNLAPSPYAVQEIVHWLLGSLADRSFDQLWLAAPFILAGAILMLADGRALDALALGEDTAQSLGFHLVAVRWRVIAGVAMTVGAAVSVTGVIGFVGLVVPHLLRPVVGYRPSALLALSALGGAALTLASDIALRLLPSQFELKLGVVTALIGAPFFLYLVLKFRRSVA